MINSRNGGDSRLRINCRFRGVEAEKLLALKKERSFSTDSEMIYFLVRFALDSIDTLTIKKND